MKDRAQLTYKPPPIINVRRQAPFDLITAYFFRSGFDIDPYGPFLITRRL